MKRRHPRTIIQLPKAGSVSAGFGKSACCRATLPERRRRRCVLQGTHCHANHPNPAIATPSIANINYAYSRSFHWVVTAIHDKPTLPARTSNAAIQRIPLKGRPSAAHPAAHTSTGSMEQGRLPHYWVQAVVVTLPLPSSPLPHPCASLPFSLLLLPSSHAPFLSFLHSISFPALPTTISTSPARSAWKGNINSIKVYSEKQKEDWKRRLFGVGVGGGRCYINVESGKTRTHLRTAANGI